jgi:spore coat polysaccharide biosynthesis protein SpsF
MSCWGRRLGGKSLLEGVVRQVTDSQCLGGVIVVVHAREVETGITRLVPSDVPVYVGEEKDELARCAAAAGRYPAESVVLVAVDSPFVDPALIDRLVATGREHPECDYISFRAHDGTPAVLSPLGVLAQWCTTRALAIADRQAVEPLDRQQVTRYLFSHPETFTIRLLPPPPGLDRDDVRLTIDVEEDWEHAQQIFDALGPGASDWHQVASLLKNQPALRQRMAVLNRAGDR